MVESSEYQNCVEKESHIINRVVSDLTPLSIRRSKGVPLMRSQIRYLSRRAVQEVLRGSTWFQGGSTWFNAVLRGSKAVQRQFYAVLRGSMRFKGGSVWFKGVWIWLRINGTLFSAALSRI